MFLANGIYYPSSLGVFTLMPQGLRALQKLIKIIDQEMEAIGAEKIQMPSLVPQRLWEKTGTVQCIFTFPIYLYLLDVHFSSI